jgi:FAD synthetase
MRVFPILDWNYNQVWQFLRKYELPYCSLYDEGYTSLGEMDNSSKNPHLREEREDGTVIYRPAYMLDDEEMERESRVSKAK